MNAQANKLSAAIEASILAGNVVVDTNEPGVVYAMAIDTDKVGSLKDGSKGQYVILSAVGEPAKVIRLHPQAALALVTKHESGHFHLHPAATEVVMVDDSAPDVPEVAKVASPEVEVSKKKGKEVNPDSKKQLVASFYRNKKKELEALGPIVKVNGRCPLRTACMEYMQKVLGMSGPGSSTYYQNLASGHWA